MKILKNYVSTLVKSVVVIFTMVSVVSCQKNKDDNPQPVPPAPVLQAVGFWQGHYQLTGSVTNYNLKVLIKPGGVARLYNMGVETDTSTSDITKYDATWTLTDTNLAVEIVSDETILFSGIINSGTRKWTGSWKRNGDVKGTFTQAK